MCHGVLRVNLQQLIELKDDILHHEMKGGEKESLGNWEMGYYIFSKSEAT